MLLDLVSFKTSIKVTILFITYKNEKKNASFPPPCNSLNLMNAFHYNCSLFHLMRV